MTRFCTRTKGFTPDQNKQFAKDLKDFAKQEAEKFRDESETQEDSEE